MRNPPKPAAGPPGRHRWRKSTTFGRDRRGSRTERRGLRQVVHSKGRRVACRCMILPTFAPGEDPGPDFACLARRLGLLPAAPTAGDTPIDVPHGTTCVAARFADGVIMAGDRRATSGHLISHRSIEKRCSPQTATRVSPLRAPLDRPSKWCGCSNCSWSTTKRWKAVR